MVLLLCIPIQFGLVGFVVDFGLVWLSLAKFGVVEVGLVRLIFLGFEDDLDENNNINIE